MYYSILLCIIIGFERHPLVYLMQNDRFRDYLGVVYIGVGSFLILGGGGGPNPARPTSILKGGGAGYCQKYI